ncbi:MAG: phospholipase/Carboxylesterase [Gemmatimonadetes bacterium]|nr:phospholipase/Carboxylesterase [Gemmatimonadota bacterium]
MSAIDLHVHRWVPPESPGLPTLLLLHGTGGDENDLLPLGRQLLPGAAMLSPRGNVLEQGAPRFFRRLAEGVFDIDDLHRRTDELADFVAAASTEYGIDPKSLYAVGYSNGANIAGSTLLSRPAVLAGGVLFRAMVPFEPATTVPLSGKRVLISAGKLDQMISPAGTERLATILRGAGADVDLEWQPTGHGLTAGDLKAAQRFFAAVP